MIGQFSPYLSKNILDIQNKLASEISPFSNGMSLKDLLSAIMKADLLKNIIPKDKYIPVDLLNTLLSIGYLCDDQGLLLGLGANCFAVANAFRFFDSENYSSLLKELRDGKKIAAFAATEVNAGSDIMSMQCTYSKTNDHYILNGEKCYITNAVIADYYLIFATKNPKLYDRGISLFIVPKDTLGISIERTAKQDVLENAKLGNIKLDKVSIPHQNLIGKELQGAKAFHYCIKYERAFILVPHIGMMNRWLDICLSHVNKRRQFNKSIASFQMIEENIVEMYRKLTLSKLLAKEIILNANAITDTDASFVKLSISESLLAVHKIALEIVGALGLLGDCGISNKLSDSFASTVYSGSNNLQKVIISAALRNQ